MGLRHDISTAGAQRGSGDQYADKLDVECLIIGAGFGGVYLLHKLRDQLGMDVKVFEAGKDLGGIWHWNCYPGARVDSPVPVYEYSLPEVYRTWTWTCTYPDFSELRDYFHHVDKQLNIRKDVAFNTRAVDSQYDPATGKWTVKTEDGRTATAKYLILAIGFAAQRYIPDWPGIDKYKGVIHHSSFWPDDGVDVAKSRVAVIGTGATGIQLSQSMAKQAKELTVFVRTPNLCLPMRQKPEESEAQQSKKGTYDQFYVDRRSTFAGFPFDFAEKNTFDDTPEQREAFYEDLWQKGGFNFWLSTYKDMLFVPEANKEAWNFWVKKTRARISDPVKRDILAPSEMPHFFGTKRPSLEQDYYESMDRPNVTVVDVKKTPIVEFTEKGIKTGDGVEHEFDMVAVATGFDSNTGGMKNMGLKDVNGVELAEKWSGSAYSYLGMTCNGMPNMFFLYGVHGPTAFSNGPTCVEVQADWIVDTIKQMKDRKVYSIEATHDAERAWHAHVQEMSNLTLFPLTKSWYMGNNVPGKKVEALNYTGGFPMYRQKIWATLPEWDGFHTVSEEQHAKTAAA